MARAAALLKWGSPLQIHNAAMIGLVAAQMELLNRLDTEEAKEVFREDHDEAEVERIIQKTRENILAGELRIDVGQENWKQLGFDSAHLENTIVQTLCQMGLTIYTSHYKSFFLTSDNPVVTTSAEEPNSPGVLYPSAEVWFPIGWNRGLLWSWKHKGGVSGTFSDTLLRDK